MFEAIAEQGPAGVLTAMTEQLAKLPSQLWRTGNEGFADIAQAMDAHFAQAPVGANPGTRERTRATPRQKGSP